MDIKQKPPQIQLPTVYLSSLQLDLHNEWDVHLVYLILRSTFSERNLLQMISSKHLNAPRFEVVLIYVCQHAVSWQLQALRGEAPHPENDCFNFILTLKVEDIRNQSLNGLR